jgi:hypothetical protein
VVTETLSARILTWLREAESVWPGKWYTADEVHAAIDSAAEPVTREEVARAMPMGDSQPFGGYPLLVARGKGGATVYRAKEGR